MFYMKYFLYFIFLHLVYGTPQINLYYTDGVSEHENNNNTNLQENCLRILVSIEEMNISRQIISYCMSESFSKLNFEKDNSFPRFSFVELAQQNITSQQLYLWSAPIDIIERYQDYLNQSLTSNNLSFEKEVFYNCTFPRFGSICQYEFIYYDKNHASLYEIIHDFYHNYEYKPTEFTCYNHLKCNRGYFPSCLDWSEICDGKVDCLDGNFDEEHCWQLEISVCKDNEYQCSNGQCIPQAFYLDDSNNPDCLDGTDEPKNLDIINKCPRHKPLFGCEDRTCDYTFLTSSCVRERKDLLIKAMYSIKDDSVTDECWSAFKCLLSVPDSKYPFYNSICPDIIQKTCPEILYFPNVPVLFGHIYTAYTKIHAQSGGDWRANPPYICYNNSLYDHYFYNSPKTFFKSETCFFHKKMKFPSMAQKTWEAKYEKQINELYYMLKKHAIISNYTSAAICNKSNMYQCINSSKCITKYHIMDNTYDCPYQDDENIFQINNTNGILEELRQNSYKCKASNKYINKFLIKNGKCDCGLIDGVLCEDEDLNYIYSRINISFQTICDGFNELIPINIEERNETDKTECEYWECNNIYTRCDGLSNCLKGEDEIDCNLFPLLNCTSNEHICVSPHTNQFMCLPIEQVNDGKIDCLGSTDEPIICISKAQSTKVNNFYCVVQGFPTCILSLHLCNSLKECDHGEDEQFCEKNRTFSLYGSICQSFYVSYSSDIEKFLCNYAELKTKEPRKYFSIDQISKSVKNQTKNINNPSIMDSPIIQLSHQHQFRCHRGLDIRVWLNNENNLATNTCLCPPTYYGSQCQYQNQRISLTIKFRALSDSWQTLFSIIILLIDSSDKRIIHSYEQITYLSVRDCNIKYQIYLLYSIRPKNQSKNYSIHIDIYEKISLNYRGSLLFRITFSFLPVYRLALIVNIPISDNNIQSCSNEQCNHGKCIKYSNNIEKETFCQCERGWSGRYCNIEYNCTCSFDSLCIGITANNRSICVCPINKFGSRCFLIDTICQNDTNSTCENNGQCIPNDEYIIRNQKYFCVCPKGFSGNQCEILDKKIHLSFEKDIILSGSIFIHFIEVIQNDLPVRTTNFKTISLVQNSLMIYWSQPFHLIFIEFLSKTYFLVDVQLTYNKSRTIEKKINLSNHCPHIREIFNETFVKLHIIRRIKYYHLPCQNSSLNLSCFYDDVHFCLCYNYGQKRLANCFNFDQNMTFDCLGQSECQNGGQCFQDNLNCPQRSMCICPSCYYGRKCQFSTSGFGLSLDAILGYHIIPHRNIKYQPSIVKFSLSLTIIFIPAGFINGFLALITFKNKIVREVGCGLYLLGSSITTLFIMILFGLKFSIFILAQMTIISNKLFLQIQCISLDFLLQVCLNINQWLNACVAMERAITAIKGVKFNKRKSKKSAKLVIIVLLIIIIGTFICDPIYRNLIDEENNDDNEKRIWCVVNYSPSLKIFNSIMHTFHFFAPFLINLVSAIILITKKSHQQSNVQTHRKYKEILREQLRQHKHLFTAPIILVILALPRLIIIFVSKCMKSINDSWLFLIGYFISFIPSMLTFVIFILPSKFYKKEFHKSIVQYRATIQRRLHLIS